MKKKSFPLMINGDKFDLLLCYNKFNIKVPYSHELRAILPLYAAVWLFFVFRKERQNEPEEEKEKRRQESAEYSAHGGERFS